MLYVGIFMLQVAINKSHHMLFVDIFRGQNGESESRKDDLPGERTENKVVNFLLPMQTIYNGNSENRNKALRSHYHVTFNHRLGLIHPV